MSEWTLGGVKARGMEIVALCEAEGCRQLFAFNLKALIEGAGPDFLIADIPAMACPQCGASPLHPPLLPRSPAGRRLEKFEASRS